MLKKHLLTFTACSVMVLSSCSQMAGNNTQDMAQATGVKAETSEDLLAAQGSWNLVEDHGAKAPMDLHSSAKKQVDPDSRKKRQFIPKEQLANVAGTNGEEDMRFRLLRMEKEVAELRGDFDKLLPPLSNLIVADNQLDDTIQEIITRPSRKPDVPQEKASQEPMHDMAKRIAQAADPQKTTPSSGGATAVQNIRFGEHPGKTRMVLDLSGESKYRADVDNNEKLLLIELSGAGWATTQQKLITHPLVSGYTAQPGANGGTMLALELKKPVKILGSAALKPNSSRGHRIYLDLASG